MSLHLCFQCKEFTAVGQVAEWRCSEKKSSLKWLSTVTALRIRLQIRATWFWSTASQISGIWSILCLLRLAERKIGKRIAHRIPIKSATQQFREIFHMDAEYAREHNSFKIKQERLAWRYALTLLEFLNTLNSGCRRKYHCFLNQQFAALNQHCSPSQESHWMCCFSISCHRITHDQI